MAELNPSTGQVVAADRELILEPNANLYNLSVNTSYSTVHVATPVYRRSQFLVFVFQQKFVRINNRPVRFVEPHLLSRIKWSDISWWYKTNKDRSRADMPDLSFQLYCGKQGFMRYFPGRACFSSTKFNPLHLYQMGPHLY